MIGEILVTVLFVLASGAALYLPAGLWTRAILASLPIFAILSAGPVRDFLRDDPWSRFVLLGVARYLS